MPIRLVPALVLSALVVLLLGVDVGSSAATATATVTVRSSKYGRIVFDGANRALYAFTRDPRGKSVCYGACAAAWPPYTVRKAPTPGPGTARSLLGTTRRREGTLQLTYAGRPLYRYAVDPVGQVLCQNVSEYGGLWLVVRGSGKLVRLAR